MTRVILLKLSEKDKLAKIMEPGDEITEGKDIDILPEHIVNKPVS